ncbi:enoyl-CoA hydratase/isomerase domain-containing protein [Ditylenchus destructor]|nr:enoyl-CoA hydratase/isomerase domain-containing protein [Ditylenchus destructor]
MLPEADHRRDRRRLHRGRRRHRRGLRPAHRCGQCEDRLSDRQDPRNCLSMANYARLAALIGPARVIDLVFTARLIEAEEAKAAGLLNEILPDATALHARAEELARLVAGHAPLTLRATKEAMRRLREAARNTHGDDLVTMCFTSADFAEGVDAFLARRPANWQAADDNQDDKRKSSK